MIAPVGEALGIAREHATSRIPIARAEQTAGEVRAELSGQSFDYASCVAVVDAEGVSWDWFPRAGCSAS